MTNTIELTQELHQNFIDFSYEANSQRAFADARDGLKPGQRACLWEMYDKGYLSSKPHVKSAKISGGVIANWWPHGDQAIYDTFARMSQPWINNIPEVDWHGANGSQIISGEAAASRYTEARLAKVTEEGMFAGIKKDAVPMIKNFSEDADWPEVLPAILPRLMINGCQGIGVTIANVWLPHNLKELYTAICEFLETNTIEYTKLYPDFPSGGIIINQKDIHTIYETGKGKVILRAKTEIKNNSIFITEFPYQVYVEPWMDSVKKLIADGTIDGIEDIYNRSSQKNGILVEVECSNNPGVILNQLFNATDLQKSYNANQYALVGKTPILLNFKEYLKIYIEHNLNCIKREAEFDLKKAKARAEIVEGLIKALEDIDNIIALIKSSESAATARVALQNKYNFTSNQSKAIVDMKLGRLAHLEGIELQNELNDLTSTIENCNNIIANKDSMQVNIFRERLESLVKKYSKPRKTEVMQIELPSKTQKEIEEVMPEDVVVVVTKTGDVKRIPKTSFRAQNRAGRGVKTIDDVLLTTISTNTIDTLMIFTNKGKLYRLLVDKVPVGTNISRGTNLASLCNFEPQEKICAVSSLHRDTNAEYVIFFTKNGLVKKTKLEEYQNLKKTTGIQAIKFKDNDELVDVTFVKDENLLVVTKQGLAIQFASTAINPIGRVAVGVRAVKLGENDYVIAGLPISKKQYLAVFTEKGLGKMTELTEYPIQTRGGKGIYTYKPSIATGELIAAILINKEDSVLITGKPNSICISGSEIPIGSRIMLGNIIIKNSKVTGAIKL